MKKLISGYQTFLDWLEKATMALAMIMAALMFLNTSTGIIVDQVVGNSLVWIEEVNILLFAWGVFVGAGVVARHGGHIGVDIIYSVLGPALQLVLRVGYLVLTLIVVWVMVYYGVKMALFVGQYQTSLYLNINLFYFYLSVPVGGVLMGLFSIGAMLADPRTRNVSNRDEMPTAGGGQ